ncbi:unnamed protein product, partial [Oncorhynchus mykiss]
SPTPSFPPPSLSHSLLPSLPSLSHSLLPSPFSLPQCGFFRRVQYEDQVPQYHAVKIPHQDLPQFHESQKAGVLHKKEWTTHWSDGTS